MSSLSEAGGWYLFRLTALRYSVQAEPGWCGALLLLFHLISSDSWTSRVRASLNLGAIQWTRRRFPQVLSRTVLIENVSSTAARRAVEYDSLHLVCSSRHQNGTGSVLVEKGLCVSACSQGFYHIHACQVLAVLWPFLCWLTCFRRINLANKELCKNWLLSFT